MWYSDGNHNWQCQGIVLLILPVSAQENYLQKQALSTRFKRLALFCSQPVCYLLVLALALSHLVLLYEEKSR